MMASGEIRLSGTMPRQMPVLAQSQMPQNQTASDGLQEIVVTSQSLSESPYSALNSDSFFNLANVTGSGVHLSPAGYAHIVANHMQNRQNKGNYNADWSSYDAQDALVAYTIANGTPYVFASGEMGYVADVSGFANGSVGTDRSGQFTQYNTVQVSLPGFDPNYLPEDRVVLTAYPGLPGNWPSNWQIR